MSQWPPVYKKTSRQRLAKFDLWMMEFTFVLFAAAFILIAWFCT